MTAEHTIEQVEEEMRPVMAAHFWRFYILTIVFALLISFHHVFSVLPLPVIMPGTITKVQHEKAHIYAGRGHNGTADFYVPHIQFMYKGQNYEAAGGWHDGDVPANPMKVIFDAGHPERAFELSFFGLIDFQVFRVAFPLWVLLSGILFAFVSTDSHFTAFNFKIPTLSKWTFAGMLSVVLLIPLFPSADLLLFGKKADGIMNDELNNMDGLLRGAIVFNAGGNMYSTFSSYVDEYERQNGKCFSILYRPDNPNRNCVYELGAMYNNSYVVLMIFGIIVVVAWFLAGRD